MVVKYLARKISKSVLKDYNIETPPVIFDWAEMLNTWIEAKSKT